jgi:hypothetical protein
MLWRVAGMGISSGIGQPAQNKRDTLLYSCIYIVLSDTYEFQICVWCYKLIEGS